MNDQKKGSQSIPTVIVTNLSLSSLTKSSITSPVMGFPRVIGGLVDEIASLCIFASSHGCPLDVVSLHVYAFGDSCLCDRVGRDGVV